MDGDAHPIAPSHLADGRTLDKLVAADPAAALGPSGVSPLGQPVAVPPQDLGRRPPPVDPAHPSQAIAAAGFAREEAAGIALGDSPPVYKDPNHKPELICALTEFEALCGFPCTGRVGRPATSERRCSTLSLWARAIGGPGLSVVLGSDGSPLTRGRPVTSLSWWPSRRRAPWSCRGRTHCRPLPRRRGRGGRGLVESRVAPTRARPCISAPAICTPTYRGWVWR